MCSDSVLRLDASTAAQGSSDLKETATYGADFGEEGEPPVSVLFDGGGHYDLLVDADPTGTKPAMPLRPLSKL